VPYAVPPSPELVGSLACLQRFRESKITIGGRFRKIENGAALDIVPHLNV
jgi:hypothetical protein